MVAFLRGINVGGRTVKKERLQESFGSLGFRRVATYRQSGNVVFETMETDRDGLRARIRARLRATLGYDVAVFLRTIPELRKVMDQDAFKGRESEGASFLVTFLPLPAPRFPLKLPLTIPRSSAEVISAQGAEVFSVTHGGGEGALPNPFVEKSLNVEATTRNMNVVREIVERFG